MLKKIIILLIISFSMLIGENAISAPPPVNCIGLPGCIDNNIKNPLPPTEYDTPGSTIKNGISNLVSKMIQYVSIIAVLSLMFAGLMYLVSGGEEEKTNKAKKMIIWSLIGVFLSISAWLIINLISQTSLNL